MKNILSFFAIVAFTILGIGSAHAAGNMFLVSDGKVAVVQLTFKSNDQIYRTGTLVFDNHSAKVKIPVRPGRKSIPKGLVLKPSSLNMRLDKQNKYKDILVSLWDEGEEHWSVVRVALHDNVGHFAIVRETENGDRVLEVKLQVLMQDYVPGKKSVGVDWKKVIHEIETPATKP